LKVETSAVDPLELESVPRGARRLLAAGLPLVTTLHCSNVSPAVLDRVAQRMLKRYASIVTADVSDGLVIDSTIADQLVVAKGQCLTAISTDWRAPVSMPGRQPPTPRARDARFSTPRRQAGPQISGGRLTPVLDR
jgi:hypothetical protein